MQTNVVTNVTQTNKQTSNSFDKLCKYFANTFNNIVEYFDTSLERIVEPLGGSGGLLLIL